MSIYVTAMKPTLSVTEGFLPAAERMGLPIVILTDRPDDHAREYRGRSDAPVAIEAVNVHDPAELASTVWASESRYGPPEALFSNSDHLQFTTSLAAELLGLPAKDWRAALRCKNKALTRKTLADSGLDSVFSLELLPGQNPAELTADLPFPMVLKPREGVATEGVRYVSNQTELIEAAESIRHERGPVALVLEEYLSGEFFTYETLGDGHQLQHTGSWQVELSSPPLFHEIRDSWQPELPAEVVASLNEQLTALGVGLGACHTEFVFDGERARIIEVNYRLIGGGMDILTSQLTGTDLFSAVIHLHRGGSLEPGPDLNSVPVARGEYIFAETTGRLSEIPEPSDTTLGNGVRLIHRPIQEPGAEISGGHTKRDFLSAVHAMGPSVELVEAEISRFLAAHSWKVES